MKFSGPKLAPVFAAIDARPVAGGGCDRETRRPLLIDGNVHYFGDAPVSEHSPMLTRIYRAHQPIPAGEVERFAKARIDDIDCIAFDVGPPDMLPGYAAIVAAPKSAADGTSTHERGRIIIRKRTCIKARM